MLIYINAFSCLNEIFLELFMNREHLFVCKKMRTHGQQHCKNLRFVNRVNDADWCILESNILFCHFFLYESHNCKIPA